jgi:hypothetical protein
LQNERLPTLSFRPQGEISGGKVRDFSLSLEMTGNIISPIFAHQQSRYFASGSREIKKVVQGLYKTSETQKALTADRL